jgi:hypothetical protein
MPTFPNTINTTGPGLACGVCGAAVQAEDHFCENCGARLVALAQLLCFNCRTYVASTSTFCENCGTRLKPLKDTDLISNDLGALHQLSDHVLESQQKPSQTDAVSPETVVSDAELHLDPVINQQSDIEEKTKILTPIIDESAPLVITPAAIEQAKSEQLPSCPTSVKDMATPETPVVHLPVLHSSGTERHIETEKKIIEPDPVATESGFSNHRSQEEATPVVVVSRTYVDQDWESQIASANAARGERRFADSENFLNAALRLVQETGPDAFSSSPGARDDAIARTYSLLAGLYEAQNRLKEAEGFYTQATAMWNRNPGSYYAELASADYSLGMICKAQKRFPEAKLYLSRALVESERALGPNHLELTKFLNGLGLFYAEQKNYLQAEPLLERSMAILSAESNDTDPRVKANARNLQIVYQILKRTDKSASLAKRMAGK